MVCVLALVGGCLLLSAPAAMGAPPANDKFEDAEDLGSEAVRIARSNVEATKEASGSPFCSPRPGIPSGSSGKRPATWR